MYVMPRHSLLPSLLGLLILTFSSLLWADDPLLEPLTPMAMQSAERQVRGVLRAHNQAVLSSELPGRIIEMPFTDGQDFSKGDVLARFDCSAYQAQLNAAQAAARATREELNHKKQLAALNSVGRFEVALAEARQAQAQAELAEMAPCPVRKRLAAIDLECVRPLRAIAAGTATDYDVKKLDALEAEASELRAKL
jgi:multidrug efflux pump subunit AcrA (membrane-fusion protein)